jgi:SAM-dependent methyltransferase
LIDLPLKPVPSPDWQEAYDRRITTEPWLVRKTDRMRRTGEHFDYLYRYVPELLNTSDALVLGGPTGKAMQPGLCIDIGPGPGETLEILRHYGYDTLGIDAPDGRGGMGDGYLEISRLMTERQGLKIVACGFERWIFEEHHDIAGRVALLNSRGSFEQTLSRYQSGEPHDEHHDCRKLRWVMTSRLQEVLAAIFTAVKRLLRPKGIFLVHCNGAANAAEFDELMTRCGMDAGLGLVRHEPPLVQKWMKA